MYQDLLETTNCLILLISENKSHILKK